MIDIQINDDGKSDIAFVKASDLRQGRQVIYVGGNMPLLNSEYSSRRYFIPERLEKIYRSPLPGAALLEEEIENNIVHESTHIIIYALTKSIDACAQLDQIDTLRTGLLDIGVCDKGR